MILKVNRVLCYNSRLFANIILLNRRKLFWWNPLWKKGLINGIIENLLEIIKDKGEFMFLFCPSICAEHYEVDENIFCSSNLNTIFIKKLSKKSIWKIQFKSKTPCLLYFSIKKIYIIIY